MVFLSSLLMWSVTLVAVQMLNQPAIPLGRETVGHVCTRVYTHRVGFDLLKPVFRDCSVASCAHLADTNRVLTSQVVGEVFPPRNWTSREVCGELALFPP